MKRFDNTVTRAMRIKTLALVLSHAALVQIVSFSMRPTLSYAVLDAGGSAALLGIIVAAFAVPALFLALPAGRAIDRLGERPVLVWGAVSFIAATITAILSRGSFAVLLAATALLGVGQLLSAVGQQAVIANTTSQTKLDSRFGYYSFVTAFGQTVGPLLLILPGGTPSVPPIELIFIICGGLCTALLGISAFIPSSPRTASKVGEGMLRSTMKLLRTPGVARALLATSVVLSSVDLFLAYMPALGHEQGLAATAVSTILVIRSMFSMLSRLFLGPMVRLFGRRALMVTTIAFASVALGALAIPLPIAWLITLCAIYGFTIGTCQPITMSWISELAQPGNRGLAMSLRMASNRMGQTVLPVLLGSFAAATGAAGVLFATGVVLVVAAWSSAAVGKTATNGRTPPADHPVD